MKLALKNIIFILLLFFSCENREWDNPFDPDCPKEIYTPSNFTAEQEGDKVILSWNQSNSNISGFKIERQVENENFSSIASPGKNETSVTNDISAGGKLHTYKLYAMAGSNKSNEVTATITPVLQATLTTKAVTDVTATSANSGGTITDDGGGPVTIRGVVWSTTTNPTLENNEGKTEDGSGTGSYTSELTGLEENTNYFVRAYATNSKGTVYGNEVSFKTDQSVSLATVTTIFSNLTSTGAVVGGNVVDDGNTEVTERGVCWIWEPWGTQPTKQDSFKNVGSGTGDFSVELRYLKSNTNYYVRAYAVNEMGISYGETINFTTQPASEQTVTDIDGNVYPTVTIGDQIWMAENLKTTKYIDGTAIPNITDDTEWANLTTGAYCWYGNNTENKDTYGALYNWYAVNTGKLCPEGWRVPTQNDWGELVNYMGGVLNAGVKAKSTTGWFENGNGTDDFGFSAFPTASRSPYDGEFDYFSGKYAEFWSSSVENDWAKVWGLSYDKNTFGGGISYKDSGYPVRCIKE